MMGLYQSLLGLYPADYRREYSEEMAAVFCEARHNLRDKTVFARATFCGREIFGLLSGAMREHLRPFALDNDWISFRRLDMRPEFRFARSTVVLMSVVLAGLLFVMATANGIQTKYAAGTKIESAWVVLPSAMGFALLIVCLMVGVVWGVLYALRQTGAQRLANLDTSASQK